MTNQKKAYLYGLLAIVFWSTVATAFKKSLQGMDFLQLLLTASVVSLAILLVFVALKKQLPLLKNVSTQNWWRSALGGFLNPFLYYVVLLKAYSILPAQIAQPLNYTWPIVLVLLSAPFLGQQLGSKSLVAAAISFSGVFMIAMQGQMFDFSKANWFGIGLAAGSSIIWASYWILNQKNTCNSNISLLLNFLFGSIYTALAVFFFSDFSFIHSQALPWAVYVGFFEVGITFIVWLNALKLTRRNDQISNLVFLSPFLSLIWIHLFLGETIFFTTVVGIMLIVAGIVVQQVGK